MAYSCNSVDTMSILSELLKIAEKKLLHRVICVVCQTFEAGSNVGISFRF